MGYYCNQCKKPISDDEYDYSTENYSLPLCRVHQQYKKTVKYSSKKPLPNKNEPTPEASKLGKLLENMGWKIDYEKNDGYKQIDIAIVKAKVNIEVDGSHHNLKPEQALADLKRTYYSWKKGYVTLRIPNSLVRDDKMIKITAEFINRFLKDSIKQLEEDGKDYQDDFWGNAF